MIRIKTIAYGNRVGTLISSEYESRIDADGNHNNEYNRSVIYNIISKDVTLFNVDSIKDGDYKIELFKQIYTAAPITSQGQPAPRLSGIKCFAYMN